MGDKAKPLALCVQVEDEYGQGRLKGRVVIVQPDGELHNPQWQWPYDHGSEFYGLEIGAYVGDNPDWRHEYPNNGVWGPTIRYVPFQVENARQAKAMASVFGRIERGLAKANDDDGYLKDDDYAAFVLRVARVLKIGTVYVRNSHKTFDMTGQRYRKVSGSDLQYWVQTVASDVDSGHIGSWVR